jgi:hypothetical protein
MSRTLRALAALALTVLLVAGAVPAAAAPLPSPAGAESVWTSAWDWLVGLFAPDEAGVGIDPNGRVQRPSAGPNGDAGGTIDPDGLTVISKGLDRAQGATRSVQ